MAWRSLHLLYLSLRERNRVSKQRDEKVRLTFLTPLHQTPSRRIGLLFVACARDVKGEPARRLTLHEVINYLSSSNNGNHDRTRRHRQRFHFCIFFYNFKFRLRRNIKHSLKTVKLVKNTPLRVISSTVFLKEMW